MSDSTVSPARAIATSTLWQIASQLTMAAMSIVTIKFVAIGLTKELAGDYNTAYGYLQLFGILADFGLYAVAVRELARSHEQSRTLGAVMILRCVTVAISFSIALAIAWSTPAWRGTPLPLAITIAAAVPILTLIAGVLRAVFQVAYRMQYVFIAEVTQRILTVSIAALLIGLGAHNSTDVRFLFGFLLAGSAGAVVLSAISVYYARRICPVRLHWDTTLARTLLITAAPYGIAYICTAFYRQFDVTLIAHLRPHDFEIQNAYYGFVQRMMDMAYVIPTFLLNSALPSIVQKDSDGQGSAELLGRTLLSTLLLCTTAFLFAFLWPQPLTRLLTTSAYMSSPGHPGSDTALQILSVSMFMNGIVLFSFYTLLARHRWKPLVASLFAAVVLSLISNFTLIPTVGFVGAATTSAAVHTFLAALLLPQALLAMSVRFTKKEFLQWLSYALLLGVLLLLLRPLLTSPMRTVFFGGLSALWMLAVIRITGLQKVLLR